MQSKDADDMLTVQTKHCGRWQIPTDGQICHQRATQNYRLDEVIEPADAAIAVIEFQGLQMSN